MRTVDQVVTGNDAAALAAAVAAAGRGRRVLIVLRSAEGRGVRRFRRRLRRAVSRDAPQILVVTNAEVVCIDGIDGVEAVVIRDVRTGRLCAVNASAFVPGAECDAITGVSGTCSSRSRARRTSRTTR
jgi:thioredoxin reductase